MRVKCLAQEHNTMSPARTRTRTTRSGVERINHEATAPPCLLTGVVQLIAYDMSRSDVATRERGPDPARVCSTRGLGRIFLGLCPIKAIFYL